jgi:hypothetical protein
MRSLRGATRLLGEGSPFALVGNVTVERADDGKLRCTCTTWDDAVVILRGEALTLVEHRAPGCMAERADDGKLRCTCATWDDAVVIPRGKALTLVNIERQVLPSARRLPRVWYRPPAGTP